MIQTTGDNAKCSDYIAHESGVVTFNSRGIVRDMVSMKIKKLVWHGMDSEEGKDQLVVKHLVKQGEDMKRCDHGPGGVCEASISEFAAESAMQVRALPLPDQLNVRLSVKTGDPLTACRDNIAPIDFLFPVATGYGGLRGTVEDMFARQLPNMWHSDIDLYLKPSNNAPQQNFSVIQEGERDFKVQLETVWYIARLRKNGQADFRLGVFAYVPRPQRATTLRRATTARVEEQAPRIAEFVREHAIAAGPATQRYMSVQQARLPEESPIQTPDDTTFRQLQ
ncbi:hypothetical protein PF008_g28333 [Phytophthora fragariae]|uniref:Uncharacterized protein n=1 Tax=Phytophthora fragariae TaxID=53985 RepID=A0A6G0QBL7_9STRA|nr:hypothetical protein PF008_g28333 [Phytophthora fragariae]